MTRTALFVSSSTYVDPQLAQLPSAARDAIELGRLFSDPQIGPFTVSVLENPGAQDVRVALEDLFVDAAPDDIVVLYLSGHGLKDMQGNLYFAAKDTRPNRLQSSAVSAQLLCSLLNSSRAEGAAVFLDCCYGGAFARGMVARAAGDPHVGDAFAALGAGSRTRAVITASSAIEYAFEGERLADAHIEPSVFASAMREGIVGGDADQDGDGWVGLNELFDFIGQRIRRLGKPQTPHLWTFGASGDLQLTRNPRGPRASVSALPAELRELLTSPMSVARLGAVTDLQQRAASTDLHMARAAVVALTELVEDDSLRVRAAAQATLATCTPRVEPSELTIQTPLSGIQTVSTQLIGPPIALDVFPEPAPAGITATVSGDRLVVQITSAASTGAIQLQLRWAGGSLPLSLHIDDPREKRGRRLRQDPRQQQPNTNRPQEPRQTYGQTSQLPGSGDTPELADWAPRVAAALIDGLIIGIPSGIGFSLLTNEYGGLAIIGGLLLTAGFVLAIWDLIIKQGTTGQTIGKGLINIKLVSQTDGRPIGETMSLVRQLCHIFDVASFFGFFLPMRDPMKQTIADKLTWTIVIKAPRGQSH